MTFTISIHQTDLYERNNMEIPLGKRTITHSHVMGTHRNTWKLKEGEEIEVIETLQYGNSLVRIQGIEDKLYNTTIERISVSCKTQ